MCCGLIFLECFFLNLVFFDMSLGRIVFVVFNNVRKFKMLGWSFVCLRWRLSLGSDEVDLLIEWYNFSVDLR